MTNITIKNQPLESLPVEYRELVALRVGKQDCKSMHEIVLKKDCLTIITRSFTYSTPNGQPDSKILEHQTNELFEVIRRSFGSLTIDEVRSAFKRGLDGVYGPYYGMCGKTYTQFLKGFYMNPDRSKAWMEYLNEVEKPKTVEVPEHIKVEKNRDALIKVYQEYKKTGKLPQYPLVIFDCLTEWKGVEMTQGGRTFKTVCTDPEVRMKLYNEAKLKYEQALMLTKQKEERRGNYNIANKIGEMLAEGKYKSSTIENTFKESLVYWYFDNVGEF
jgi:hypothetical protein